MALHELRTVYPRQKRGLGVNDIIVVAGCTHRDGFLDEYENQLADAGIDFHLHPLEHLPLGANSITMRRRIAYFRQMAERFSDYQTLFITDAWDVLFFGTKQELVDKAPTTFLCSAERNCYPEADLASRIHGSTAWRYANNGMIASNPLFLLAWCDDAERVGELDILDQAWFNRRRAYGDAFYQLDVATDLFYVVSAWLEDGALQMKDGRPWNAICETRPNFFHFSGKCPSDSFRAMLRGEAHAL